LEKEGGSMKDIFIHIGLPKTGTTYLQKYVFPKIKGVNYLSPLQIAMPNYILSVEVDDRPLLISDEYLSTNYFVDSKGHMHGSRYTIAENLKKIFPDASIIIVLREKEQWLKSFYLQYLKSVYRTPISFEKFKKGLKENGTLDFEKYIEYLKENFRRVLVLDYEELRINPHGFIKKICDFMGVETPPLHQIERKRANVRLNDRQISFITWVKNRKIKPENKKRLIELFLFITGGRK